MERRIFKLKETTYIEIISDAWHLNEKWWNALMRLKPKERHYLYGNKVPRDYVVYGKSYRFSNQNHQPQPMPYVIRQLMKRANRLVFKESKNNAYNSIRYNMALVNWYLDENDSIYPHSDNENEMLRDENGDTYPVACFSFGETRRFVLKSKKKSEKLSIDLEPNSLVVMGGKCQTNYTHAIPKEKIPKSIRISVTFRVFKDI